MVAMLNCWLPLAISMNGVNCLYTVGLREGGLSSVQYTFIASENLTANMQLLQLLEARFGINHYCICLAHTKAAGCLPCATFPLH